MGSGLPGLKLTRATTGRLLPRRQKHRASLRKSPLLTGEHVTGAGKMTVSAKPKSITLFNQFNLAASMVGIANIFSHYALLRNLAISKGTSPAGPILGVLLLIISYVIFWLFIYRRGSNIAKWIFVAVTVISVAMIPFKLHGVVAIGMAYAIIDAIAFTLQIAAMIMLFRRDAKVWLAQKGNHQANA